MKMKTFLASIRTDTPITLMHQSFMPIDYDQAIEMHFTKKVKTFSNGELTIVASEFFSRVTYIELDCNKKRLVVYVA